LKGIMPALLTGFTDDLSALDTDRIRALVRRLIKAGVHGVYVGGSSGEMLLLSIEERKQLMETVVEEAKGKITVIAHIGEPAHAKRVSSPHTQRRSVPMRCPPSRRSTLHTPLPMSSSIISTSRRHRACLSSSTTSPRAPV
ncbi:MAG: dihydrodipicolinate synthase family protein, partial [Clostridia bacterium]|nr:dihydrodipicolinate synthase family protein [Clostridia bacterium]